MHYYSILRMSPTGYPGHEFTLCHNSSTAQSETVIILSSLPKDAPANDPGEPGLILAIYGNVLRSID